MLLLLTPCGATEPHEPVRAEGGETPAEPALAPEPVVAEREVAEEPPPPPDPALTVRLPRVHSRLTPEVVARLREIVAAGNRSENVFAKMGGSSIESRAFLHCLAHDRNVDLGGRDELQATLEFFREGNVPGGNSFGRGSIAARKGWSVRHGLTGRPSRVIQEVQAISPRYALVFFGGNDVQGRNPMHFGERLEQLIESVVPRGVVPILGATTPRGDDADMDLWARKFNRVSHGIARAWGFPYIDFYLALEELPNRGLAGDGVHSNVLRDGGRSRACVFTEEGLERGMNMRNLRTLEGLHRVRQAMAGDAPDPSPETPYGLGTADEPLRLPSVPWAERLDVAGLGTSLASYACGDEEPVERPGPERVYRIRVDEPRALWVGAIARRGSVGVYLLDEELGCVSGGGDEIEVELQRGVHHVAVELGPDRDDATLTVMFDTAVAPAAEDAAP